MPETIDLAALSTAQVAALSTAQVAALSTAQVAALTSDQLIEFSTSQLVALTSDQLIEFSTSQVAALTSAQVVALTSAQVAALKTAQIAALTSDQLIEFSTSQVAALTSSQVAALTSSQVAALTSSQVVALTSAQVASLTSAQVASLTMAQVTSLNSAQVKALDSNIANMTDDSFSALPANLIPEIAPKNLLASANSGASDKVNSEQINSLANSNNPEKAILATVTSDRQPVTALTNPEIVSNLPPKLAGSSLLVTTLAKSDSLQHVTKVFIENLSKEAISSLSKFSSSKASTGGALGDLADQIRTKNAIVTRNMVRGYKGSDLMRCTAQEIQTLIPVEFIRDLTKDQLAALDVTKLSVAQLNAIIPGQIQYLNNTQKRTIAVSTNNNVYQNLSSATKTALRNSLPLNIKNNAKPIVKSDFTK